MKLNINPDQNADHKNIFICGLFYRNKHRYLYKNGGKLDDASIYEDF